MNVTSEFHGLRRVLEALKITSAEWNATHEAAQGRGSKVIYLSDVRKRAGHSDEPLDPPPGAAAARPYKLTFVQAVGPPEACAA
jgi:hypothetical protein